MESDGALVFPPHVCFHLYSISSSLQLSSSLDGFCQFHPNNGSSPEIEIGWFNCTGYQDKPMLFLTCFGSTVAGADEMVADWVSRPEVFKVLILVSSDGAD